MFVQATQPVPVGFDVATARLTRLAASDRLEKLSDEAYGAILVELITLVRPEADLRGLSRQVRVGVLEPRQVGDVLRLPLRWWTTRLGGRVFPALDADLDLCPGGGRAGHDTSSLRITARYEPPLPCHGQKIDRWVLYGAANSTVRRLLRDLAETLVESPEVVHPSVGAR